LFATPVHVRIYPTLSAWNLILGNSLPFLFNNFKQSCRLRETANLNKSGHLRSESVNILTRDVVIPSLILILMTFIEERREVNHVRKIFEMFHPLPSPAVNQVKSHTTSAAGIAMANHEFTHMHGAPSTSISTTGSTGRMLQGFLDLVRDFLFDHDFEQTLHLWSKRRCLRWILVVFNRNSSHLVLRHQLRGS
jgi:hypothetical protein